MSSDEIAGIVTRRGGHVVHADEDFVSVSCCRCHVFGLTYHEVLSGIWCRRCYVSAGEQRVDRCLRTLGIDFYREHTFPAELRYVEPLRLDFYIPALRLVIEFDGISHYRPRLSIPEGALVALRRFTDTLTRDRIKDTWCERTGRSLLRVPFWRLEEVETLVAVVVERCRRGEVVTVDESREWRIACLASLIGSGEAIVCPRFKDTLATERRV